MTDVCQNDATRNQCTLCGKPSDRKSCGACRSRALRARKPGLDKRERKGDRHKGRAAMSVVRVVQLESDRPARIVNEFRERRALEMAGVDMTTLQPSIGRGTGPWSPPTYTESPKSTGARIEVTSRHSVANILRETGVPVDMSEQSLEVALHHTIREVEREVAIRVTRPQGRNGVVEACSTEQRQRRVA